MGLNRVPYRGIDPATVPGRVLHCRADQGIHMEAGTENTTKLVEQWDDLSGLAHHLLQTGVSALKPVFGTVTGPNGLPGVVFTAAIHTYLRALFTLAQPMTVQIIVKAASSYIYDGATAQSTNDLFVNGAQAFLLVTGLGLPSLNVDGPVGATNMWQVVTCVYDNKNTRIRSNGGTIGRGTIASGTSGGITLGAHQSLGVWSNCSVNEIVVWNRGLTEREVTGVDRFAGDRINIFAG